MFLVTLNCQKKTVFHKLLYIQVSSNIRVSITFTFSRRFYPKRLTIAFRLYIFISICFPWELNPQPFALLTQCSTTEPHRNSIMTFLSEIPLCMCFLLGHVTVMSPLSKALELFHATVHLFIHPSSRFSSLMLMFIDSLRQSLWVCSPPNKPELIIGQ